MKEFNVNCVEGPERENTYKPPPFVPKPPVVGDDAAATNVLLLPIASPMPRESGELALLL